MASKTADQSRWHTLRRQTHKFYGSVGIGAWTSNRNFPGPSFASKRSRGIRAKRKVIQQPQSCRKQPVVDERPENRCAMWVALKPLVARGQNNSNTQFCVIRNYVSVNSQNSCWPRTWARHLSHIKVLSVADLEEKNKQTHIIYAKWLQENKRKKIKRDKIKVKEYAPEKNISLEQIKIWAKHIAINLKNKRSKQSYHIHKARAHIKYTRAWGRYCKTLGNEIWCGRTQETNISLAATVIC